MAGLMPKFLDDKEAMQIHQAANWQGDALIAYLKRAREQAVKALLLARGEDTARLQGSVMFADEFLEKVASAREVADKMERASRGQR